MARTASACRAGRWTWSTTASPISPSTRRPALRCGSLAQRLGRHHAHPRAHALYADKRNLVLLSARSPSLLAWGRRSQHRPDPGRRAAREAVRRGQADDFWAAGAAVLQAGQRLR